MKTRKKIEWTKWKYLEDNEKESSRWLDKTRDIQCLGIPSNTHRFIETRREVV